MSRKVTIAGLIIAIVLAMALIGCGKAKQAVDSAGQVAEGAKQAAGAAKAGRELEEKGETTVKTDEGEMKIKTKDDETVEMTIEGDDGKKMTMTGGRGGDISGLQMPIYPGAEQQGSHTMKADGFDRIVAQFSSSDSFEKVADFYKDKLPDAEKTEMTHNNQQSLILHLEEDKMDKTVTVVKDPDEENTVISVQQQIETSKEE